MRRKEHEISGGRTLWLYDFEPEGDIINEFKTAIDTSNEEVALRLLETHPGLVSICLNIQQNDEYLLKKNVPKLAEKLVELHTQGQ